MTIEEAYRRLRTAWPGQSFCIGVDVWHHDHTATGTAHGRDIEWSIYDAAAGVHHRGTSLEAAIEQALGCDGDLSTVDGSVGEAIRDHQLEADRFHGRA